MTGRWFGRVLDYIAAVAHQLTRPLVAPIIRREMRRRHRQGIADLALADRMDAAGATEAAAVLRCHAQRKIRAGEDR